MQTVRRACVVGMMVIGAAAVSATHVDAQPAPPGTTAGDRAPAAGAAPALAADALVASAPVEAAGVPSMPAASQAGASQTGMSEAGAVAAPATPAPGDGQSVTGADAGARVDAVPPARMLRPSLGQALAPAAPRSGFEAPDSSFARERVPFSRIFVDLRDDVTHLASRENLWIVGIGAGLALASSPSDRHVTAGAFGSHQLDEAFDAGAVIGGGLFQVGAALTAYTVGRVSHNDKLASVGRDLVRAQVLNTVLTQGIKFAVQRERPDGTNYSFPSGHASTAFATATVLSRYYGLKVGIPAYAVAAFVGTNRLTENRHYLSDVAFGAAIGIMAGRTSTLHIAGARFALAPTATPNGGFGVSFVRVPGERDAH